jgi:glycosyltransferase involved in cell wall biosynthesis
MKVLILASWYPSKLNSLNGVFVREQAIALARVGVEVVVLFPYDRALPPGELGVGIEEGILTYRANTDYLKNSKLSRINSIFKCTKLIDSVVKKHGIEIIHAQVCYSAGFAAAFYSRKHGVPFVITEHMSYIAKYSKKIYNRKLFSFAYSRAKVVIPVSTFLEKEMRDMGYNFKSHVLGNVVNIEAEALSGNRAADPQMSGNEKEEYNILFIGLMSKNRIKGIEYLIPAFSNYLKNNPEQAGKVRLHFAGDGELRTEYEEMCTKLSINNNVVFHGKLEKFQLNELIVNSDFLVVSSIKETFGAVLIEAMAAGLPVLSTRCGGPEDFVNDRVGKLVETKNIDALEKGIKDMIHDLGNFDSELIKSYTLENFSGESIGNKLKEIYRNI